MATIKKISGISDAGSLTTSHRLLVEDPSGNLRSTTVGAVNNHTHSYLPLSGGSTSGNISRTSYKGGAWISGRDNAAIRTTSSVNTSSFAPVASAKTQLGSWDLGPCNPDEHFYFSYATDANYNANNNSTNSSIYFTTGGTIHASSVYGAVWNDLSDSIPVDDDCELEHGYCYCFDGEKYFKSSKYLDEGIVGIHSDTYGFRMGDEKGKKKMDVAVAGFVLAYVDKEYKPGTPLTCTENGYLTEIRKEDKIEYPERIVATYWKNEPADEWGSDDRKVKVNGRKWVKVT